MRWHPLEKTAQWLCFARSEREKRNPSVHDTDGCNSLLYDWGHSVIIPVMDGQFLFHTTLILWDMQFSLQASFQRRGQGMQMVKRREGCVKGKKYLFIYLFCFWGRQLLSLGRNLPFYPPRNRVLGQHGTKTLVLANSTSSYPPQIFVAQQRATLLTSPHKLKGISLLAN